MLRKLRLRLKSGFLIKKPCVSRSKSNQTIKFSQLIAYNIRNIFLQKLYTKCGEVTSPRPLWKIKIDNISGSIV